MKRLVSGMMLSLLLIAMPTLAFNIQTAKTEPATIVVPDDHPTIQAAINAAVSGDVIYVRAGAYNESIVVDKAVSLVGEDRETTIIDGWRRNRPVIRVAANNVVISGFTVMNYSGGFPGASIWADGVSNISIIDSTIRKVTHGITLMNSLNPLITGNNFSIYGTAIMIALSRNIHISQNHIQAINGFIDVGISVGWYNQEIIISNNTVTSAIYYGIGIGGSSEGLIFRNSITGSATGIRLSSASNITIRHNNISSSYGRAMWVERSWNNRIIGNNITRNKSGITFVNSSGNVIYHNNFVDNTVHAEQILEIGAETYPPSINVWDNGYPSGGNYWSDYNGTDLYSGPYQNVTGSDEIGDTPYATYENNTDRYPLMKPYTSAHALAVNYVRPDRTIIAQGLTTKIDVDIVNYGLFTETFNLTLYANTTTIDQKELTLTSVNIATVTFTWNTTGLAKGNYTLTAQATPVPGEMDTTDNNSTCWVIVSMVGDLTGPDGWPDGKVDIRDIALVARAFGAYPGHPRWNPIADINYDFKVDIRDIALVASHFGEADP